MAKSYLVHSNDVQELNRVLNTINSDISRAHGKLTVIEQNQSISGAGTATPAPGLSPAPTPVPPTVYRVPFTFTSNVLGPNVYEIDTVPMGAHTFFFFNMSVNVPARIRIYGTMAAALADQQRVSTVDPVGNHGMYLEMLFIPGALSWYITPIPICPNQDATESPQMYFNIQNNSASSSAVIINATMLIME